jgi:hypothetical protein
MFTTLALGTAALLFVASGAIASEDVAGTAAREAGSGSKTSAQALLRSASHRRLQSDADILACAEREVRLKSGSLSSRTRWRRSAPRWPRPAG